MRVQFHLHDLFSFYRLRLVMPPILFMALSLPMTQLAHFLFPAAMANGTICGSFVFCEWLLCFIMPASHIRVDVIYDTMHYAYAIFIILSAGLCLHGRYSSMHHTKLPSYLREQKKYHLAHHYKNFELGFGVTSMVFLSCCNTSSNVWFQVKFGTMCLTQCFHSEYWTVSYS